MIPEVIHVKKSSAVKQRNKTTSEQTNDVFILLILIIIIIQENSSVVRDVIGATIPMSATPDSKRMTIESMEDDEKALKQYANDLMTRY